MKFAYADPPYLGKSAFGAAHHYGDLHPKAADFDGIEAHKALIDRLDAEFEAWALSLSSTTLRDMLPLCPPDVRIGAWAKSFASWKPNVNPAYCWEPVIFRGGRGRGKWKCGETRATVRDYCIVPITLKRGLPGAKPDAFCWWVFDFLGAEADDDFHDLFPGSGAVGRAWEFYKRAKAGLPLFAAAGD